MTDPRLVLAVSLAAATLVLFLAVIAAGGALRAGLAPWPGIAVVVMATAAFDTDAACMLVTAVGVPDYRSRPGGTPRHPTHLTGFDDLMGRLHLRRIQSRRGR